MFRPPASLVEQLLSPVRENADVRVIFLLLFLFFVIFVVVIVISDRSSLIDLQATLSINASINTGCLRVTVNCNLLLVK